MDPSPKNSSLRSEFYRPSLKGRVRNTIEDGESDTEADVIACHPIRNLAQTNDRFELDPAQHIQLLKALRGTGRTIIGCYHSHPNGRAEPSATDLSNAAAENFLWLIATDNTLSAFIHSAGAFHPIRLA